MGYQHLVRYDSYSLWTIIDRNVQLHWNIMSNLLNNNFVRRYGYNTLLASLLVAMVNPFDDVINIAVSRRLHCSAVQVLILANRWRNVSIRPEGAWWYVLVNCSRSLVRS